MTAAAFFPIAAALFYGASYALIERAIGLSSVATLMLLGGVSSTLLAVLLTWGGGWEVRWEALRTPTGLLIVLAAIVLSNLGFVASLFAVKAVNATYAAIGEVSYPIFVPLFAFLFFGLRQWDTSTVIGGALVLAGIYILIIGQTASQQAGG